jgi:RHS repeat-associated protein
VHSRQGYYPYGETRYAAGTLPTDFGFTGQRNDATIGLYDYHARWYDPTLGRFISADTIVPDPGTPQDFNRYAYVSNNPLRYTDPSGHCIPGYDCPEDRRLSDMVASLWDPAYFESVGDPQAAEQAFLHFLADPASFISLYLNEQAWTASEEVANLDIFFMYSTLHATAEQVILNGFSPDTADYLRQARILYSVGDQSGGDSLLAIAAAGVAVGGDTCLQCGTVRPDLARSCGKLRIDPDGASVWCHTCIEKGISNAGEMEYWKIPWDATEAEALKVNVEVPEWTGPEPDHFGIFRGGPTDTSSPLWDRLNQFIRSFTSRLKWGGPTNKKN